MWILAGLDFCIKNKYARREYFENDFIFYKSNLEDQHGMILWGKTSDYYVI